MKQNRTLLAIAIATLAFSPLAFAQTTVVTRSGGEAVVGTTTTTAGTISEFSPDTIIVRSETSPEPIRYSYTKTTTYIDDAGQPVSLETVKSGLPVTVHYIREGDRMIANRVIVHRTKTVTEDAPAVRTERRVEAPAVRTETRTVAPAPAPVIEEKKTTTTTTTEVPRKRKD
ncbi:MAG TPA: hypothetical protein VGO11_08250 [Chthoniobacteraceae bacterium]|jgi:hypothetical protein|nr:hypothetical protein [Chthoniobacteraceae bacterium]